MTADQVTAIQAIKSREIRICDEHPVPAEDRLRRDDGGELAEALGAETLSLLGESTPLRVGEPKPPVAEVLAEDWLFNWQDAYTVLAAIDGLGTETG